MTMDMSPTLYTAAFTYEDGRVLYVLKEARACATCGRKVKLVVEVDGAPPKDCVACVENAREVPIDYKSCLACGGAHTLFAHEVYRRADGKRFFICPKYGENVFINPEAPEEKA